MNNLNSVLVEGVIAETPEYSESTRQCTFTIESNRYNKVDGVFIKKTNIFIVSVTGKMADTCSAKKKGSGVRVIGTLDTAENNSVIIRAEHIEYKPEK